MNTCNARGTALFAAVGLALLPGLETAIAADTIATGNPDALQEVVITASPIAHEAERFATIVETVDRNQILQQGGTSLADALATTPGISGTSFAVGASRPVIRGFDANRVRVLEDGIGSFDVSDVGPDHGVPIDPLSAQRIEIVRGAATLRYGNQAIGGVVNAINNRVPMLLPEQPYSGEASGSFAGGAHAGEGSALFDARAGQVAMHADGFMRRTSDYAIPDGTQGNSFFRGDGYSLGSSYFFGDSRVGAGVIHYDAKYGIPSDTTHIDMKQTKGMLRSSFAVETGAFQTLTVDGGYADYEHTERESDGTPLATFKDKEWDARSEAVFGQTGPWSGSALGVQLQHKDFSALGAGADYLLPTTTRSAAAFGFAEVRFSKRAHAEVGARIESVEIQGTPASNVFTKLGFTPFSASLGLVFDATPQVGLGLLFASAARSPSQAELFAHGPHDAPATYEIGDPTLKEERANSLEGTLRLKLSGVRIDSSLWVARFNRYVFGDLTGRSCDDGGACGADGSRELRELNYRQVDATFRGVESKAILSLTDGAAGTLSTEVMGDYVRATIDEGGNLPRIPPYHLGVGLRWNGVRIDSGLYVKYSGPQRALATAETPTDSFTSVDVYLGWRSPEPGNRVSVTMVGHNLADSVQRNAVAFNKDSVVLPGRDLRLVLRITY